MGYVEICGIRFSDDSWPEDGLIYRELRDWDGVADARGDADAIPGRHGRYARTSVVRDSRVISVEAAIVADSDAEFHAVKRRVEAIPSLGVMRVDDGDGYWCRDVEVARVTIPDRRWKTFTPFTIDLVAPDPVRYRDPVVLGPVGVPVRSGGLVLPAAPPWDLGTSVRPVAQVVNDGTVPVLPIVRVQGSGSSLTVQGGPRRIEIGPFSGELTIDSRERRAWLDGREITRQLVRRDWHEVPAGAAHDFYFTGTGLHSDTVLTVEYRIGVW